MKKPPKKYFSGRRVHSFNEFEKLAFFVNLYEYYDVKNHILWCNKNTKGKWGIHCELLNIIQFRFGLKKDAAIFKLFLLSIMS